MHGTKVKTCTLSSDLRKIRLAQNLPEFIYRVSLGMSIRTENNKERLNL
jgi:hypothetical protein